MKKRTIAVLLISVVVGIVGVAVIRGKGGTVLGQAAPPKPPPTLNRGAPTPAVISEPDCNAVRAQLEALIKSQPAGTFGQPSFELDCERGIILIRVFVLDSWLDKTGMATMKETLRSYGNLSSRGLFENWRIRRVMATSTAKCLVEFFTIRNGSETTIATYDPDKDALELK